MNFLTMIGLVIFSYLIGSVASAIVTCKLLKLQDPRQFGSGNPGATNVLRLGGKKAAFLTGIGDVLKGFLPVIIAQAFAMPSLIIAFCWSFAVLGHMYPLYFSFRGGKGVATLLGGLLAISWQCTIVWIVLWILTLLITRYVSIASMLAAVATPILLFIFTNNWAYVSIGFLLALIIIARHQSNIKRIMEGEEPKINLKKVKRTSKI